MANDRLTPELEAEARRCHEEWHTDGELIAALLAEVDRLRAHPLVAHEAAVWSFLRRFAPTLCTDSESVLRCRTCTAIWPDDGREYHGTACAWAALPDAVKERL